MFKARVYHVVTFCVGVPDFSAMSAVVVLYSLYYIILYYIILYYIILYYIILYYIILLRMT